MRVANYFLPFFSLSFGSAAADNDAAAALSHKPSSVRTLHQWPLGTWAENIAVRPNGNLLVTFISPSAALHELNPASPPDTSDPAATLLHAFANATQATGIAELGDAPDVFAVVADSTVYRVDLRPAADRAGNNNNNKNNNAANNGTAAAVTPIATIAGAGLLNGMASLPGTSILLIADSELGAIWRLDAQTGAPASILLRDPTMAPSDADPNLPFLGINGIRYGADGHVYFNNSPLRLFCRVPVHPGTGDVAGAVQVVARGVLADDFAVRWEAAEGEVVAYLAGLNDNVVTRVTLDGTKEVVAGNLNSSAVAGATAGAWGRTPKTGTTLFVTTGGGTGLPVNGTYVEGGKVVALRFKQ
ncbi:Six-bladed beta-propeller TolB-like protein [Macrophomina phaseolina MS6]|uniref:Six-bladed beta-propeller TolB-like protein n=1 Tax=Macrophomina phaseolina (strain MS6) TaxID=1126212 RepID=K2R9Z7_MACPH|nr:Six-bladed beta-propeller TolB-like protein [Macrophomina phaseolina MS6]